MAKNYFFAGRHHFQLLILPEHLNRQNAQEEAVQHLIERNSPLPPPFHYKIFKLRKQSLILFSKNPLAIKKEALISPVLAARYTHPKEDKLIIVLSHHFIEALYFNGHQLMTSLVQYYKPFQLKTELSLFCQQLPWTIKPLFIAENSLEPTGLKASDELIQLSQISPLHLFRSRFQKRDPAVLSYFYFAAPLLLAANVKTGQALYQMDKAVLKAEHQHQRQLIKGKEYQQLQTDITALTHQRHDEELAGFNVAERLSLLNTILSAYPIRIHSLSLQTKSFDIRASADNPFKLMELFKKNEAARHVTIEAVTVQDKQENFVIRGEF